MIHARFLILAAIVTVLCGCDDANDQNGSDEVPPEVLKAFDNLNKQAPLFHSDTVIPGRENWTEPHKISTPEGDIWQGQYDDFGPYKRGSRDWRQWFNPDGRPRFL